MERVFKKKLINRQVHFSNCDICWLFSNHSKGKEAMYCNVRGVDGNFPDQMIFSDQLLVLRHENIIFLFILSITKKEGDLSAHFSGQDQK